MAVIKQSTTYVTALVKPSILSICEKAIRGTLSESGFSLHTISLGISSSGEVVRIFFGFGSGDGSDKHRFARSCESCVKFIGAFQAA